MKRYNEPNSEQPKHVRLALNNLYFTSRLTSEEILKLPEAAYHTLENSGVQQWIESGKLTIKQLTTFNSFATASALNIPAVKELVDAGKWTIEQVIKLPEKMLANCWKSWRLGNLFVILGTKSIWVIFVCFVTDTKVPSFWRIEG